MNFIRARAIATLLFLAVVWNASLLVASVPSKYTKRPDDWFRTDEGRMIVGNVISWQAPGGSWPKNGDTASKPFSGSPDSLQGTFDNSATTGELRFLARAAEATGEARTIDAFTKGLDLLLKAQYANGGWPQRVPATGYSRHITFNDGTMTRILELMFDIVHSGQFKFLDEQRHTAAERAFDLGIACILKCQIVVQGKPTVWCAQHDEVTFAPRPARAYELVSLSGGESASILKLLMRIKQPSIEVRQAIEAGVAWFESSKIRGLRVDVVKGDKIVSADPQAPDMWARFYEIETNRPFFCGRDGVKKYQLSEIEAERRNGYGWYGSWGTDVQENFLKWKKKSQPDA